ncbi:MAG: hypothetical protein PWR22_2121 [Moorella sp. (in: firmicutes)]|nr:hypothetical protein [Moorella sp. (in: firmicutes)]
MLIPCYNELASLSIRDNYSCTAPNIKRENPSVYGHSLLAEEAAKAGSSALPSIAFLPLTSGLRFLGISGFQLGYRRRVG